jgi:preprotein translocase subunit SecG
MIVFGLLVVVHVVVSLLLIGIILLQGGRGGLGDALGGASAQTLFGGGVNTVMTKVTAIGAGLFMVTCLLLAKLSTDRGRSVIEQLPTTIPEFLPGPVDATAQPIPAEEAQPVEP